MLGLSTPPPPSKVFERPILNIPWKTPLSLPAPTRMGLVLRLLIPGTSLREQKYKSTEVPSNLNGHDLTNSF
jgi:hypothetical protein